MITLYQDRFRTSENATLSRLWSEDIDLDIFTLERRWLHNRSDISCFPSGVYALVPWQSPKFGNVLAYVGGSVTPHQYDAPEYAARWGCLMHGANYWTQLNGCVAPGMSHGEKDGDLCVWNSRDALKLTMDELDGDTAIVYVNDKY